VAFGSSRRERQYRIKPVQRLDGSLFIGREHDRMVGWVQVQAQHVGGFLLKVRIIGEHVPLESMRLQPGATPYLGDQAMTAPMTVANLRVLQCVLPSDGGCRVFAKIRASIAGVRTVGGCPRYFARSPARRSVSNRCFHRVT
jgi:hypothetical protein